ncbi:helix-turn-helix domain-containing protein [Mycolicibacterium sp. XJ775]
MRPAMGPPSMSPKAAVLMPPDNDNGTAFNPRAFRRSLRRAGITATQYRLAVELCEYANQDRSVVWPSVAVLAEDCEISERSVVRMLNQLESHGFIACDGGRKGGRGCSTRWRLIVKGDNSGTLYGTKGDTSDTVSEAKRVTPEAERVTPEAERVTPEAERVTQLVEKGDTRVTRRREEEGKKKGGRGEGGLTPPPTTPPRVSRDSEPPDCCPEHEPPGVEKCEACFRAWRKHEAWEAGHPQSWREFAEEVMPSFRMDWVTDGPPRFCDRDHGIGAPCGACGELRALRKEWDKRRQQWERDREDRREEIDGCDQCDGFGRIWVGDDPDPWWCEHGYGPDPPPSSFGTVSSVLPDLDCEAVPDALPDSLTAPPGTGILR